MNIVNIKEYYPQLYEYIDEKLRELLETYHDKPLSYIHLKLFSAIMKKGYWDLLTENRLHLFVSESILAVLFIAAEGDRFPNIIVAQNQ